MKKICGKSNWKGLVNMKKLSILLLIIMLSLSVIGLCSAENENYVPIKKITLEDETISLLIGSAEEAAHSEIKLNILPEDATVKNFTYSSSNENVVTVDENGKLEAVGIGKAKITIIPIEEKPKAKAICNVVVDQAVTNINIPASQTVQKGKGLTIKPVFEPKTATNKKVTYTSSDPSIVTVSASGAIKGIKCGKATVTCAAVDGSGITASSVVTVVQPVTRLTTKAKKVIIFEGESSRWEVTAEPSDASNKNIKYISESTQVASIDNRGNITGNRAGKTKLTATSTDESKKSCSINLIVEPSAPISLDSLGFGIYNSNLLGLTVTNKCSALTIVDFDFSLSFYDWGGNTINSGFYSLGSEDKIGPGRTKTIKRTVYGTGQAYKTVITIIGVKFSDGTYWNIPASQWEVCSFSR